MKSDYNVFPVRIAMCDNLSLDPEAEATFYKSHRDEFLTRYAGRLVAVRDEEVVADAETYFELNKILCERYGGLAYAYIKKVTPQSFEDWADEPAYIVL